MFLFHFKTVQAVWNPTSSRKYNIKKKKNKKQTHYTLEISTFIIRFRSTCSFYSNETREFRLHATCFTHVPVVAN